MCSSSISAVTPMIAVGREKTRLCGRAPGEELQDRICPIDMPIQGILIGEHALGESLTDDNHRLRVTLAVEIAEITAGDDRNTERGKESGRDGTPIRAGIVYAGA